MKRLVQGARKASTRLVGAAALAYMAAGTAFAQMNAGAIATNLNGQVLNWGPLIEHAFQLGGVIIVGLSLWKWYHAQKQQQPVGMYIIGLLIGVLMVAIPTLIGSGTMTFFNSGASGLSNIGVN